MIVHRNGKWLLLTSDGKRVLGTHGTKEEAQRQENAIYASQARAAARKTVNALTSIAAELLKRCKHLLGKKPKGKK